MKGLRENNNKTKFTDKSMEITRQKGGWRKLDNGKGGINGYERRLDLEWCSFNIEIMDYKIV